MRILLALLLLLLTTVASASAQSGTIDDADEVVSSNTRGTANGTIQITGTFTGTLAFEGTVDGSTWFAVEATPVPTGAVVTSATAGGQWTVSIALASFRVRASAWTSGAAVTSLLFTSAGGGGGGGASVSGSVSVTDGLVSLETPNSDSAMDDTFDAVKVVTENVVSVGGQSSSSTVTAYPNCTSQVNLRMTTATTTELIPLTGGELVRICYLLVAADANTDVTIVEGTGTNCGTGQGTLLGPIDLLTTGVGLGWTAGNGAGVILDGAATGNAICVTSSAGVNLTIFARYTKY